MSKARQKAASRARAEYSDALVERIAVRHAAGTWLKHACALEGATYMGLRQAVEREPRWAARIEAAHAEGTALLQRRMLEAGVEVDEDGYTVRTGDWKREAWMLERWDQETFHLTTKAEVKNEHGGPDGKPLTFAIDLQTAHALAKLPKEPV